jgi:hypothetical protein
MPLPIGFPRSDVFRHDGKNPLRSINLGEDEALARVEDTTIAAAMYSHP